MLIDKINLNHLRVFEAVYRNTSMTEAAKELHLTQSGVSQHMRALEESLGITLFDRIQQKLVPTAQAQNLYQRCKFAFKTIEVGLNEVTGDTKQIKGTVALGVPVEFGVNVVIPRLSQLASEHPLIKFQLSMDFASVFNDMLLKGDLDLAFVDDYKLDPRIKTEIVYHEVLELCILKKALKKYKFEGDYEKLDYVEYEKNESLLRMWFGHHLKRRNQNLNIRATVMDVNAIAAFIVSGLGAGVLPRHVIDRLQREGNDIHIFEGCGKALKNSISVAYLEDRTQSQAVQLLLAQTRKMMNS